MLTSEQINGFVPTVAEPKQCNICGKGINWRRIDWGDKRGITITRCKYCSDRDTAERQKLHDREQARVNEEVAKNPAYKTL